jgi:hypothetical protein
MLRRSLTPSQLPVYHLHTGNSHFESMQHESESDPKHECLDAPLISHGSNTRKHSVLGLKSAPVV